MVSPLDKTSLGTTENNSELNDILNERVGFSEVRNEMKLYTAPVKSRCSSSFKFK